MCVVSHCGFADGAQTARPRDVIQWGVECGDEIDAQVASDHYCAILSIASHTHPATDDLGRPY
eukprot:SAG31_NODE_40794_length_279_cov_0.572222_1_plen_62_part_10